jgi:hypothetical protein
MSIRNCVMPLAHYRFGTVLNTQYLRQCLPIFSLDFLAPKVKLVDWAASPLDRYLESQTPLATNEPCS